MALEFTYSRKAAVKEKIICWSKLSMIEYVFEQLDDRHKQQFESSCFKNLLKLRSMNVGYQLFHQLLMRQVQTSKTKEIWFKFKGKVSRFGLEEFTLITGLNAGDLEEEVVKGKAVPRLLKNYFANKHGGNINKVDLRKAFDKCKNTEDKYKLGLLVCLVWVLLGADHITLVNPWLFFIVEDVDKFNNYPWGKKSFLYTVENFKRELDIASNKSPRKKVLRYRYNLHGFPLAVMIWGLEAIPAFGKKFADSIGEKVPRMLSWKLNEKLVSVTLDTFLEYEKYNVKCKLAPTEAEKAETFWQRLTHFDDVEDPKVDNFEDDDESVSGGADDDAEDSESEFSSDEDVSPETQCAGRQLDGNQTLVENHIGMGSTSAALHIDDVEDPKVDNFEDDDESESGGADNEVENGESDFSSSDEDVSPEMQCDGNRTLVENHIGMEPTSAGVIKNPEGPQSVPAQVNVTSQGQYELHKRRKPQIAPEENKRARPATETSPNINCHSISDTSDGDSSDTTYNAKLDLLEKAAAALNDLVPKFRSRPPSSVLCELEDLKRETATTRSKEKELEAIIYELRHENTELSSRCASLVAEDTQIKEELSVSRSKEKELEASNSRLAHENKKFTGAEYTRTIQELTVAHSKEKELKATISKLTHKNKVFSAECSLYESQIVALEAEYKKTKEELENADGKLYSEARAAGYAEGVKDGKSKWLKSAEFLDSLTDASVKYFDYGFDSCQKQAEQQGFVGKLDKNSALNEALNSKDQQSNIMILE